MKNRLGQLGSAAYCCIASSSTPENPMARPAPVLVSNSFPFSLVRRPVMVPVPVKMLIREAYQPDPPSEWVPLPNCAASPG